MDYSNPAASGDCDGFQQGFKTIEFLPMGSGEAAASSQKLKASAGRQKTSGQLSRGARRLEKPCQQASQTHRILPPIHSRLMQELHEQERVRGMDRAAARQLLLDRLTFNGETDLNAIRHRRFCMMVLSKEQVRLGVDDDGSPIDFPREVVFVSMEKGAAASALRIKTTPGIEGAAVRRLNEKMRIKEIDFDPTDGDDETFKTCQHFLDRCMCSLIFVHSEQFGDAIRWLRVMNDKNTPATLPHLTICLSRVMCVEDFLVVLRELNATDVFTLQSNSDVPDVVDAASPFKAAVRVCKWLLATMRKWAKEAAAHEQTKGLDPMLNSEVVVDDIDGDYATSAHAVGQERACGGGDLLSETANPFRRDVEQLIEESPAYASAERVESWLQNLDFEREPENDDVANEYREKSPANMESDHGESDVLDQLLDRFCIQINH